MNNPPMKKTVTSKVASICERRSCVRERISRNVQIIKLSQNITVKATIKPITTPNEFVIVVKMLLLEDVVVPAAVAVAVAAALGVGVAATPAVVLSIVVNICVICVIARQMPLSGMHKMFSFFKLKRLPQANGNKIGLM